MKEKLNSFEVYEDITVGLVNAYQCASCGKLVDCVMFPEDKLCPSCAPQVDSLEQSRKQ